MWEINTYQLWDTLMNLMYDGYSGNKDTRIVVKREGKCSLLTQNISICNRKLEDLETWNCIYTTGFCKYY